MFKSNNCVDCKSDCEKIMYLEPTVESTTPKNYKNLCIGAIFTIIVAFNLVLAALVFSLQRDLHHLQTELETVQDILKPYASGVGRGVVTDNYDSYANEDGSAYFDDSYYEYPDSAESEHSARAKRDILHIRDDGIAILDEPYRSNKYRPKTTTVATLKFYNSLKTIPTRNSTDLKNFMHFVQIGSRPYSKRLYDHKSRSKRKLLSRMTRNRELVEEIEPTVHNKRAGNSSRHKQFITNAHFYGTAANNIDNCNNVWTLGNWAKGHSDYLQQNDELIIQKSGIYFVYAQLYYYHAKSLSGFSVIRNRSNNLMTCAVSLHSKQSDNRTNSCYVATVAQLNAGDVIQIKDHHTAKCIFQEDKTYFGIFKLSDIKSE